MPFTGVALTGLRVRDHVTTAVEAERLGYATGWVTEVQGPDAVTVIAAAAAATSTLRLSTGIVSTYVRSPFLSAMTFASLADLSEGRVAAGFGTSTPVIVSGWHGLPFARPVATTRAYIEIFRRLLTGERVKSEGIFNLRGATLQAPSPHPVPVYLAGLNDRMLELAGEIGDGVILNFPTLPYARRAIVAIRRGLARAGRDRASIEIVANFRTGIGPEFAPLADTLRRELITYLLAPVYQQVFAADDWAADVEACATKWAAGDRAGAVTGIADAFVDAHGIFGATAAECEAKVAAFHALGIDTAVLFPVVAAGPGAGERQLEVIRALAPR